MAPAGCVYSVHVIKTMALRATLSYPVSQLAQIHVWACWGKKLPHNKIHNLLSHTYITLISYCMTWLRTVLHCRPNLVHNVVYKEKKNSNLLQISGRYSYSHGQYSLISSLVTTTATLRNQLLSPFILLLLLVSSTAFPDFCSVKQK